jgi:hypothetical protein
MVKAVRADKDPQYLNFGIALGTFTKRNIYRHNANNLI